MEKLAKKLESLAVKSSQKPEHRGNSRYSIKKEIDRGEYGTILKAVDKRSGKEVAIKEVKVIGPIKYIYRELILLKNNNHPYLLSLNDLFIPSDAKNASTLTKIYFVTECMNRSLEQLIYAKIIKLTQENISYITYQILCGVNHLHKNNLIHRDLKSANIGISNTFQIKILDFGISRNLESKMTTGQGTVAYMAPECFYSNDKGTVKADMWSVGCILSELLRKKRPEFQDEAALKQLKEEKYNWEQHLPEKLFRHYTNAHDPRVIAQFNATSARDLLSKLVVFDPEQRLSAREALNHSYVCVYQLPQEVDQVEMNVPEELSVDATSEILYEAVIKTAQSFHSETIKEEE